MDFDDLPLHEAINQLATAARTTVSFDPEFATDEYLATVKVSIHLRDFELGRGFDKIMSDCWMRCDIQPRGQSLHLIHFDPQLCEVRVYDVHDIIARWNASPYFISQADPGDAFSNKPLTAGPPLPLDQLLDELIGFLKSMLDETFPGAAVTDYLTIIKTGNCLCIQAPPRLQREINNLLYRLRQCEMAAPVPQAQKKDYYRTVRIK